MKNFTKMMKQAQQMQTKMAQMQEEMANMEITGTAGGDMVTVTLTGKGDMKSVSIDPTLFSSDDAEVVEDLLVAAHNDAKSKQEAKMQEQMAEMTGGLQLPDGFQMPF
ncbi:MAG: YbaB/EbfC family nucleoid-associated protein [Kordiimonas sp.]|nr:YbaB/EbfC family nucleoid-associated protein [Kordiimonas sp.]|tara:strand:+ start:1261 stop:1584 length:324 start_codon:yes stop_codon:yes gene_type:complete